MERIYVTAETGRLTRTDLHLVTLTLTDGTVYENLEPRRLFPTTDTTHYVTLLDKDNHEVALIRDLAHLDEDSRAAIEACFSEFYRIPYITRVLEVRARFGSLTFTVETDRGGPITFRINNRFNDIKLWGDRVLMRDSNDNRYEIKRLSALDAHSRRLLFPYL